MYIWHSRRTAPSTWPNAMLNTLMRREIDVLDAVNNAIMRSRGKSLCITSIIGPYFIIAVEQQPISKTQPVTVTHSVLYICCLCLDNCVNSRAPSNIHVHIPALPVDRLGRSIHTMTCLCNSKLSSSN